VLLGYKARHAISKDLRMPAVSDCALKLQSMNFPAEEIYVDPRLGLAGALTVFWLATAPETIFRQWAQAAR
jgi:hypothetical protein